MKFIKKKSERFRPQGLAWLFKKRFKYETRKYTSGIILTSGVTALFVSLLVIGASFLSASYRATGKKGPNIFDVVYDNSIVNLNETSHQLVNVTCGVSDFYKLDTIRLYYSINFWNDPPEFVDGVYLNSTLKGNFYSFSFNASGKPKTYLFFIWANNTAGYFNYNDNDGNYYSKKLVYYSDDASSIPSDPTRVFQQVIIGHYNTTKTREARPQIKVWVNKISTAWIIVNNVKGSTLSESEYFVFNLESDLNGGLNNLTICVLQENIDLYKKTYWINYTTQPPYIVEASPANGSNVYNNIENIFLKFDEPVRVNATLNGTSNQSWSNDNLMTEIYFDFTENISFGNYSLSISAIDHFGIKGVYNVNFSFQKSLHPYIHVFSPENNSETVNNSIMLSMMLSENCNLSVINLNNTFNLTMPNFTTGVLENISLVSGMNVLNVTAVNQDGMKNSSILLVTKKDIILNELNYLPVATPSSVYTVQINYSCLIDLNATLYYAFDYSSSFQTESFILINETTQYGILEAMINIPASVSHLEFYINFENNSSVYVLNNSGNNYHVSVAYYYFDTYGPEFRGVSYNPSINSINSNMKLNISVNLYDVAGVQNVSIIYSTNISFIENYTINMTYKGNDALLKNGDWFGTVPEHQNGTRIYFKLIAVDQLNNSAELSNSFIVKDVIRPANVPGVLNTDFKSSIIGAISTLLAIISLVIVVFIVIFFSINDQNVKRELYRERDRIFILENICKLNKDAVRKYYYIEQLTQDGLGYILGLFIGLFLLSPIFIKILKVTLIAWTYDFHEMFYYSLGTLESWVFLLIFAFISAALLIKLIQVDKYIEKLVHQA
ncbi:MAG: hypothetical protein ACTSVI_02000 [Promethearchaeota archaeon]